MNKLIIFDIPSLHCDGCISSITSVLENFSGIVSVHGNLEALTLAVNHDDSRIKSEAIKLQLSIIGYPVVGTQFNQN